VGFFFYIHNQKQNKMFYDTLDQAKEVGMKMSKENLKGYSIFKRNPIHKDGANKFYIIGTVEQKCHDTHAYFCHNYETPFHVESNSPKSGWHLDMFPTKEQADEFYRKTVADKYRTNIRKKY
jgi:hypothetical protein